MQLDTTPKYDNYRRPTIRISYDPPVHAARVKIEQISPERILVEDLAVKVPGRPFFLHVHAGDTPGLYNIDVYRTTSQKLVVNEDGTLSQYVIYTERGLDETHAAQAMTYIHALLGQEFHVALANIAASVGATSAFVPYSIRYGYFVWPAPRPGVPSIADDILDKAEAEIDKAFGFLVRSVKVTEDEERGTTKLKVTFQ